MRRKESSENCIDKRYWEKRLCVKMSVIESQIAQYVKIFLRKILDSSDGDYVTQAQILALIKPAGW